MIRTLVVVEVPFYRDGLTELLNKSGEVQVVGTANDVESAVRVARSAAPELVLIDVGRVDGAEAIQGIRALPSDPKFVALAVDETPDAVLKWAELGVAAYVARNATLEELIRVLTGVVHEEFYCSPRMAAHILNHVAVLASVSKHGGDAMGHLSAREREVLSLLACGLPNKTIASKLAISHATAKNHVHNILEKLHLQRRGQAASLLHQSRHHSV